MLHARVYPGNQTMTNGSPHEKKMSGSDKRIPKGDMLHARIYPYQTLKDDKVKGKANLEASSDPLAMRTSGFA